MNIESIEKKLVEIIKEELAFSVSPSQLEQDIAEFNIDTDDWSFLFIPTVEKRFNVRVPIDEWSHVYTIKDIARLIMKMHNQKIQRTE